MNTGQLLVSLSGLPSGSALAHLMAIQTGTGTGETIYAPRLIVVTEQRSVNVVRRAKRTAQAPQEVIKPSKAPQKQAGKVAYSITTVERLAVITEPDELFILSKAASTRITTTEDAVNISRRRI